MTRVGFLFCVHGNDKLLDSRYEHAGMTRVGFPSCVCGNDKLMGSRQEHEGKTIFFSPFYTIMKGQKRL